jgi:hypothetical protein
MVPIVIGSKNGKEGVDTDFANFTFSKHIELRRNEAELVFTLKNIRGKQLFGFLSVISLMGVVLLFIIGTGWYCLLPVTIFCSQFGYKELQCHTTHVVLYYPLRPFLRSVTRDVSRIRKVRTLLNGPRHGGPLIQIYFKRNFLPYEFRLARWEETADFLRVMALNGTFKLKPVDSPGTIDQIIREMTPSPGFRVHHRQ